MAWNKINQRDAHFQKQNRKWLYFRLYLTRLVLNAYIVLRCNKSLKSCHSWSSPKPKSIRMGKSGQLERARLANQIQEFEIPDRWEAEKISKNAILTFGISFLSISYHSVYH